MPLETDNVFIFFYHSESFSFNSQFVLRQRKPRLEVAGFCFWECFLSLPVKTDLVYTIGESVALGAAGIIMWGDAAYASSNDSCSNLAVYLKGPLNQYLLNVSTAAELCSQSLCGSHGRCLRKNPDSNVYLHLNPLTHSISQGDKPTVTGELSEAEKARFQTEFQCQCYSGYEGEGCNQALARSQATSPSALHCVILLFISLLVC